MAHHRRSTDSAVAIGLLLCDKAPAALLTGRGCPVGPPKRAELSMIAGGDFLTPAREQGFSFYAGVPCSFFTPLINGVTSDRRLDYVGAASEGEGKAVWAGSWLEGRQTGG